ncbi:hypothetical protein SOASR032_19880 [Pragia fontium]|uniref:DUF4434 domain-containing protein n=1 Tax=Pragia fontium TaxID=82985 RepID=A0ABQ5LJ58_9GAMM|nr:DUF4434 family protein [Pragia fontium]GKX63419.1 hypothetical protein SOASR032_19880 [Pragia fontium]
MLNLYRIFMIGLMLVAPGAFAINGVIYQPQLRDRQSDPAQWQALMTKLHQQQIDTLVVQWTRYGDAFQSPQEQQWLQQRLLTAHQSGLRLIIGLNADPDFFSRQNQPPAALENYLNRLRNQDVQQAKVWQRLLGSHRIDGWYISAEIDDLNWRSEAKQAQAEQWLQSTRRQLNQLDDKPVYVSSFFAGNMSPQGYQQWISRLAASGMQVWVQDGAGVAKLSPNERKLYLNPLVECTNPSPAAGIVNEVFRQLPGDTFKAQPITDKQLKQLLTQPQRCAKDRLLFSLRYLPQAQGVLDYR